MRTIDAGPHASVLIESMRDIGYSLETALADIIDNSITAGASSITLLVGMQPPCIGILDNGGGMSESALFEAMRPGSRSPLESRDNSDLGRFGLGLKTASFSQCRKLSVVTRNAGVTAAAQWDLDHVAETNAWQICIPEEPLSLPWANLLGEHGTLIVWERLDRVLSLQAVGSDTQEFLRRVDDACEHLQLIFHRFLSGEPGTHRVTISVNNRPLEPFDPFHSTHPATIRGPLETIRVGQEAVTIQAFTLPHHQKVTPAQWERYGGRAGYLKNQGFYVYRSKRLIIHGTWFGLARQMELTKLVRVRVDISNRLDAHWKIDVKKASAQPPYQVRERLRRIIDPISASSKRIFTSRGTKLVEDHRLPVWARHQLKDAILYRINPNHPVIAHFAARLPDELKDDFMKVVELAGASLPMDALFADMSGHPEQVNSIPASDEMLRHAVAATYTRLSDAGIALNEIREMLLVAEPFRSNWMQTEAILNGLTPTGAFHD
jgi:hypothetical protein